MYVQATSILADLLNELDVETCDCSKIFEFCTEKFYSFYKEYNCYYIALFFFDSNHLACSKIPQYLLDAKMEHKKRAEQPVKRLLDKGKKNGILKNFDSDFIVKMYLFSLLGIINGYIAGDNDKRDLYTMMLEHGKIYDIGIRK